MMGSQQNGVNGFHHTSQNVVIHLSPNKTPISTPSCSGPPSLSPCSLGIPSVSEGDDVLLKDKKDGLIYLGIAVEIDDPSGMCLVRFGDGDERWGRLGKEVKSLAEGDELEDEETADIDTNGIQESEEKPQQPPNKKFKELSSIRRAKESRPKRRSSTNSNPTVPKETPAHVLRARKELPYDFDSLLWDENHQRNDKERYVV